MIASTAQPTFELILDALPQTQCQRCTYEDCAAYAQAIVDGDVGIDQCSPGGDECVAELAHLTGAIDLDQTAHTLNPEFQISQQRPIAFINEDWCIGCTLCIPSCPVDAIVGVNKQMHTVIENYCTGCELCLAVCPVDCIVMESATPLPTSTWKNWSQEQAVTAKTRYENHKTRITSQENQKEEKCTNNMVAALGDLAAHSKPTDENTLAIKRTRLAAILAKTKK